MSTIYMALKNLKKNFSFYFLYLASVAFIITVFFSFTSFSVNKIMLGKISADGRVETMCTTISIFLMVFVIFYMTYSNRFFLRRRTKELGIYALLGYRKTAVLSLMTFENIFICCGGFIFGIILGSLTHKGIVFFISQLLHLGIDYSEIPFFNLTAVYKTALFIFAVVLVLLISNGRFLYKTSLMTLIRFEKSAEKKLKFHKIPAILGFIMILSGYTSALDILRGSSSAWINLGFYQMGLLTMFLIVIGTVLFISSFLPYIIEKSKQHKKKFYTDTKIITTPNFIYRIRSNSKTLIMLTLLSAATLTVSSVMALTLYYPIAAVSRIAPSEIEFKLENQDQIKDVKQILKRHISDRQNVNFLRTDIYRVTSASENLPAEYSLGSLKTGAANENILRKTGFECISYSQYTKLLKAQGKTRILKDLVTLSDDECILMKYQPSENKLTERGNQYVLQYHNTKQGVTVKQVSLDNAISFANSIGTLIVSDRLYAKISADRTPAASIISLNGSPLKNNKELYHALSDYLNKSPYLQGNSHRINELLYLNSSTFLLIGFLVVLFFIAVGSILYFNNISAVTDSKSDYEILEKIGYRKTHIKKIIRKQILTFFSIPFVLGLLDCVFATIVYKIGLMQNLLGNSFIQYIPVLTAILLTAFIYGIYYFLTVRSCCKICSIKQSNKNKEATN